MGLKVALCGIVRNEAEYLLEWIAWHRNAGFTHFFIADNQSDDGTLETLTKLERSGTIRLHRQPMGVAAQVKAYNIMLRRWGAEVDRIAFLDADEFLVAADGASPVDHLERLLRDVPNSGAIAVNWRLFGSSGHTRRHPGLVTERFTRCAPDDHRVCKHIKTYARSRAILEQRVHRCNLRPGWRYIDTDGNDMEWARAGSRQPDQTGELSRGQGGDLLKVHHYAVKSLQEYVEKKQFRGDAMSGARDRTMVYFQNLDQNQNECVTASSKASETSSTVQDLAKLL